MNVNWKVRIKNKNFWLMIIPAILLLIQLVMELFHVKLDFGQLGNQLKEIVNAVFSVLVILGIVNDPTTSGFSDSERALGYEKPWEDSLIDVDQDKPEPKE